MATRRTKGHRLAILFLLLAGCAREEAPRRVVDGAVTGAPAQRGSALLRRAMLTANAAARAAVGEPPLAWSDALAADAQSYADILAHSGRFEHAAQPQGPGREGENLWTGTRDAYRYDEMIGAWTAERRDFVNGITPAFSRTGRWEDVAHYTQMIWRGTTAVGCAVATGRRDDVLVCRYAPPGNVVGERAY
ncbi:MAG: CAP domain-containing protein [Janthinobacterium lividum]